MKQNQNKDQNQRNKEEWKGQDQKNPNAASEDKSSCHTQKKDNQGGCGCK